MKEKNDVLVYLSAFFDLFDYDMEDYFCEIN